MNHTTVLYVYCCSSLILLYKTKKKEAAFPVPGGIFLSYLVDLLLYAKREERETFSRQRVVTIRRHGNHLLRKTLKDFCSLLVVSSC